MTIALITLDEGAAFASHDRFLVTYLLAAVERAVDDPKSTSANQYNRENRSALVVVATWNANPIDALLSGAPGLPGDLFCGQRTGPKE